MCLGPCEGTGIYPAYLWSQDQGAGKIHAVEHRDLTDDERAAWEVAHRQTHTWRSLPGLLWKHREWWFWRTVAHDVWTGEYFRCDGWHFITCAVCQGTGKRAAA